MLLFTNDEDAVQSFVTWNECNKGWAVGLKDLDSGNILPELRIYPDKNVAIVRAKKIAGLA